MKNKWLNKIKRAAKTSRKRSIQFILSISFTTAAVIGMIFMGIALYVRFMDATKQVVIEDNKQLIEQVNLNLDTYLRNMMGISDSIYYHVIKNIDLETENLDKEMELLFEANQDSLVSIGIFSDTGAKVGAYPFADLKKEVNVLNQSWFITANNKIENLHFSTPHVQNLFQSVDGRYRWVVSLSRAIELTRNGRVEHGVLLVDMNYNGIERLFQKVNTTQNGYVYLIGRKGEIIYHPRQQLIYSGIIEENNLDAATYEDGEHSEVFLNEQRLVTVKTVGYTGWKIITVTPTDDVIFNRRNIQAYVLLIVLFAVFLMILTNQIISGRIANPIMRLDESVKDLEKGILDGEVHIGGSYEVRHLGRTIDSLVKQMRKLLDDMVKEQEQKRKSELDTLQSQINPHFLYNTLDSIVWMIECDNYKEAIVMVTSLASLFRISLSKGKNIISIKDELEHARHYLTIQKKRYKDRFTTEILADEDVLECTTIKLIVQPLVENAIYYGMEYMSGEGEILIHAYIKDEDVFIEVIDNGPGIPEENIPLLLSDNKRVRKKGSGIGLRNVHDRIQLYFGKEYGLTIKSEPDVGTNIRIHLPKMIYSEEREG